MLFTFIRQNLGKRIFEFSDNIIGLEIILHNGMIRYVRLPENEREKYENYVRLSNILHNVMFVTEKKNGIILAQNL